MTTLDAAATPTTILQANLALIARTSPRAARRIAEATPRPDVIFTETEQGLSAAIDGRGLGSRRRPRDEARRFAESIDIADIGGLVVLGFGLGHHLAEISRRVSNTTALIVFEPDVGLLRAVLERIDCRPWLSATPTILITDPDPAALSEATQPSASLLAMGVSIVSHPPSESRLKESSGAFTESFANVIAALRTNVITTMVQTDVTMRNVLMNLDAYVTAGRINELRDVAKGHPAIVVSAGPSLRRNLELLEDPAVRERCVIIAVQTVLKPLLARGIKPHFVTALDYHEISARFYEGLTAEDVEGVTLVAEPKANAAILNAFPGSVRLAADAYLEDALGPDLSRGHEAIESGATVAHLAYGLARRMGCDPVMLIGQDLAFTDGQYYAPNASIHDVWATELNPFNTLEMMEWERIVRMRGHLKKVRDHLDREVYTDNQMATYLSAFERDFLRDADAGRMTIDATEGGVRKQHTHVMTLREALDAHMPERALPDLPPADAVDDADERIAAATARLRELKADLRRVRTCAQDASKLLRTLESQIDDDAACNRIIRRIHRIRDEASGLGAAYRLVHIVNQLGSFKRVRADRALKLDRNALTPTEIQQRQIDRDRVNLTWLRDASDVMIDLIGAAETALSGGLKRTRDVTPEVADENEAATAVAEGAARRVTTIVMDRGGATDALRIVLDRLRQTDGVDRIVIATRRADDVRSLAETSGNITIHPIESPLDEKRDRAIRASRAFASTCWRGGLGAVAAFDEIFDALIVREILANDDACAAHVVASDWPWLDVAVTEALIERSLEAPRVHRLCFSQAPPGAAGFVIERDMVDEFARGREDDSAFATLGCMLGYIPVRAIMDPVSKPCCVQIDPDLRGAPVRLVADDLSAGATDGAESAATAAQRIQSIDLGDDPRPPRSLILELTTRRTFTGPVARLQRRDGAARGDMPSDAARRLIDAFVAMRPGGALMLSGAGDALLHDAWADIVRHGRDRGLIVGVRTDLAGGADDARALLDANVDVVTIDMMATRSETYAELTGTSVEAHKRVLAGVQVLLQARQDAGGLGLPWVAPRLTRCDRTYEEVESFYDRWRLLAGAVVIDAPLGAGPDDRIQPLPLPRAAAIRGARDRMMILADGSTPIDESDLDGAQAGNAFDADLTESWDRLWRRRTPLLQRGERLWTGR